MEGLSARIHSLEVMKTPSACIAIYTPVMILLIVLILLECPMMSMMPKEKDTSELSLMLLFRRKWLSLIY